MTHRPEFFSGVAIGVQRDFRVSYEPGNRFALIEAEPLLTLPTIPPSPLSTDPPR